MMLVVRVVIILVALFSVGVSAFSSSLSNAKHHSILHYSASSSDNEEVLLGKEEPLACNVAIVGSGPGGLVLAHALLDRGYTVRILERRTSFRPVGAAIFMHPFALNSLKSISQKVAANLLDACCPIRGIQLSSIVDENLDVGTDQLDKASELLGSPFVSVRFWDMLRALKKGLPEDIFCFGHDVQRFEPLEDGVKIHYYNRRMDENKKDGDHQRAVAASFKAGMLIDAGGIRSNIRRQLIGDEPIPRLRATYAVPTGEDIHKVFGDDTDSSSSSHTLDRTIEFVMGEGKSVTIVPLTNGDVWWTQTQYSDDPRAPIIARNTGKENEELEERINERFAGWPTRLTRLVEATKFDEIIEGPISELPVTFRWGKGNVTLLGDAAHAQLPALGLGVSTAFADVDELCRQIDRHGLNPQAFRWYERVRIPQTAFLQIASRVAYFANVYISNQKSS